MANIQWAPDYSTFIDRSQYPDAVWMDANPGSYETPGSAAGFYTPGGVRPDAENTTYGPQAITPFSAPSNFGGDRANYGTARYQDLADAGLWDLSKADSPTWKYLQTQAGNMGDIRSNPAALKYALDSSHAGEALAMPNGLATYEDMLRQSLATAPNQQGVEPFVQAAGAAQQSYWDAIKNNDSITFNSFMHDMGDAARGFRDIFTQTPLGVAALAYTGGLAAGADGATGGAAAGSAASETVGAGAGELAGESLVGPATGTVLEPGLQASGALVTPVGAAGLPAVSGAAVGAGAFGLEELGASGGGTVPGPANLGSNFPEPGTDLGTNPFDVSPTGTLSPDLGANPFGASGPAAGATENVVGPSADSFVNTGADQQLFGNGMDQYGYSGEVAPETMGAPNPTVGKGLLESTLDWANKNPIVAGVGLQVAGGLAKGVGDQQAAKDIAERNAKTAKELQAQKTAEQLNLEEERRKAIQRGSYFDAKVPIAPSGQPLRRPDGSLVYQTPPQPLLASRVA